MPAFRTRGERGALTHMPNDLRLASDTSDKSDFGGGWVCRTPLFAASASDSQRTEYNGVLRRKRS